LSDSHGNFQLYRFTTSKNIAKSIRGDTFLTHTVYVPKFKISIQGYILERRTGHCILQSILCFCVRLRLTFYYNNK